MPPLTEEKNPLAVLFSPPLTEDPLWVALLPTPPEMEDLLSLVRTLLEMGLRLCTQRRPSEHKASACAGCSDPESECFRDSFILSLQKVRLTIREQLRVA